MHPHSLALDPYGRQLFWTCAQNNVINATSLDDGRPLGVILGGKDERPRHLVLHPHQGLLFWTNLVNPPLIERAYFDGKSRKTLVSKDLRAPGALAVDPVEDLLFWSDLELRRVERIKVTGDGRKILLSNVQANALTVSGRHLFIMDRMEQCILRTDKLTGDSVWTVQSRRSHLSDILAVSRPERPVAHPCLAHPCSHLCLPGPRERPQCACPAGLVPKAGDERLCVPAPSCTSEQFACASGKRACIPLAWRCDGGFECDDHSDERGCLKCGGNEFRCRDGGCVVKSQVCDGVPDCGDHSDELCCGPEELPCRTTHECLDRSRFCDGRADCADDSDEALCEESARAPVVVKAEKLGTTTVIVIVVVMGFVLAAVVSVVACCFMYHNRAADQEVPVAYRMLPYPRPFSAQLPEAPLPPASSSASSGVAYPRETLNPPPSPATVRSYGYVPTPCSTDVCDDSEPCPCRFRCDDSLYDSDPNPPPPTPRSRGCISDASCPPSPFTDRGFCHPPPPSPVPESDY